MARRRQPADDDAIPVMVPRNDKPLKPVTSDRVHRFRKNLVKVMREARQLKASDSASPSHLTGFPAVVATAACALCKGWCCRSGGDDAYLDDRTMARVRRERPNLDARAVLRLYSDRVPAAAYENSCIFHGSEGCSLDRSLRADICNDYFCGGLMSYFKDLDHDSPRVILAGEGDAMRSSAVLVR